MANQVLGRKHFQQLAELVSAHAAAKHWPAITYPAAFITVLNSRTGRPTLEGNSVLWNADWDARTDVAVHPVTVASGEEAWIDFLSRALYPDLVRANEAVQRP